MSAPRFTAGKMGLYGDCASAYTRTLELAWFCQDYGITPPALGGGDLPPERGERLHALLSAIPYDEKFDLWDGIAELAAKQSVPLGTGDRAFVKMLVDRRNKLLDYMVADMGKSAGGVQVKTFSHPAIRADFSMADGTTEPIEGRPDFLAIAYDEKGVARRALLGDYNGNHREQGTEEYNTMLRDTAVLLAGKYPTLETVGVSLLAREDIPRTSATYLAYNQAELHGQYARAMTAAMQLSLELAGPLYDNGTSEVLPAHQQQLDATAKIGRHCEFCEGKACCSKLQRHLGDYAQMLPKEQQPLWKYARDQLNPTTKLLKLAEKNNKPIELNIKEMPVDIKILSAYAAGTEAVLEPMRIAESLRKETHAIIRQLNDQKIPVPNYSVKPSALVATVKDDAAGQELSAAAVFARLRAAGVLEKIDEATFVRRCAKVNAKAVVDLVAELRMTDSATAYDQFIKPMGESAPIYYAARAGVVQRSEPAKAQSPAPTATPVPPQPAPALAPPNPPKVASALKRR